MLSVVPDWVRALVISVISALCAGGVVAAICVAVLTQPIHECEVGSCYYDTYSTTGGSNINQVYSDDAGGVHGNGGVNQTNLGNLLVEPSPSNSVKQRYQAAAVAVDSIPCSPVGRRILEEGGTAVDAAVAVLFCNGVVTPQSMGIGGGFIMTISLSNGTRVSLIARETAPALAHPYMYSGNRSSTLGPLAAGVPGEILGAWEAKQRYGNPEVEWRRLLQPAIELCESGITVSEHAARSLASEKEHIKRDPGLSSVFLNPVTGEVWKQGDVYTNPTLGATLTTIAEKGGEEFYQGELARALAEDIAEAGGIISEQDLRDYRVRWENPVTVKIPSTPYTVLSSPPPGSGVIMTTILAMMSSFNPDPLDRSSPLFWHRFIESCKHAFAQRTMLGDWADENISALVQEFVSNLTQEQTILDLAAKVRSDKTSQRAEDYGAEYYTPDDAGTTHISVLSPAGDAVSLTSTINLLYGSKFMSTKTGIILNNQMDDFSYPNVQTNFFGIKPSPRNFPAPGKRPMSSTSPSIVLDNDRVVAVVGASGGSKIITTVAQVLLRTLFLGEDVKKAVDARRLHHQLLPMQVSYETGVTRWRLEGLKEKGHSVANIGIGGSAVQAIFVDRNTGELTANADFRKHGSTDGF